MGCCTGRALSNSSRKVDVKVAADGPDKKQVSSDFDAIRSSLKTPISIVSQSRVKRFASKKACGTSSKTCRMGSAITSRLGRDKKCLEDEQDMCVAFEHGIDTLNGVGFGTGQTAKQMTDDAADRTWRGSKLPIIRPANVPRRTSIPRLPLHRLRRYPHLNVHKTLLDRVADFRRRKLRRKSVIVNAAGTRKADSDDNDSDHEGGAFQTFGSLPVKSVVA
ncbi:hypothetical protein C8F01DRAFT_1238268 [Mycena amicta]|nr:hypothetical protein C8F01DRAFT_1238268 [Mycena amicta]